MAKKKKTKKKLSKKTAQYREMFKQSEPLCKSQVYSELYEKVKRDGRLGRFIATIQYCSMRGYDMCDTVEFVIKSFPSYIDEKEFTVDVFKEMIRYYSDIAVAWGYGELGDEVAQVMVKNVALELATNTKDIKDIEIYNNMYGEEVSGSSDSDGIKININMPRVE